MMYFWSFHYTKDISKVADERKGSKIISALNNKSYDEMSPKFSFQQRCHGRELTEWFTISNKWRDINLFMTDETSRRACYDTNWFANRHIQTQTGSFFYHRCWMEIKEDLFLSGSEECDWFISNKVDLRFLHLTIQ